MRTAAPMRRPCAVSSIASWGRRETSTSRSRLGDAELHQVDEVRAAAEERRAVGAGRDRRGGVARPLVGERLHATVSAIAATMLG